ncbi:hypothetical protein COCOBI_02-3540 [Coccomyxa sp. Obi]|nr:hypothetical protein COCOBI_02-3540 [Coccomyxa sp. Obi]
MHKTCTVRNTSPQRVGEPTVSDTLLVKISKQYPKPASRNIGLWRQTARKIFSLLVPFTSWQRLWSSWDVPQREEATLTHVFITCPLAASIWGWFAATWAAVTGEDPPPLSGDSSLQTIRGSGSQPPS